MSEITPGTEEDTLETETERPEQPKKQRKRPKIPNATSNEAEMYTAMRKIANVANNAVESYKGAKQSTG